MESWLDIFIDQALQPLGVILSLLLSVFATANNILRDKGGTEISKDEAKATIIKTNIDASNMNAQTAMNLYEKTLLEISRLNSELDEEREHIRLWESWHMILVSGWEEFRKKPNAPEKPTLGS